MDSVWASIMRLYGEYGASRANLKLIGYDAEKRSAVLRTTNNALDMTRVALASITRMRNKPVALHVKSVSGTIKSLNGKTAENDTVPT
jgi:RNase P/RNase MRP subunit POP5